MAFLSEIIGKPIIDQNGERFGVLKDIVTMVKVGHPHPVVVAVAVKERHKQYLLSYTNIRELLAPAIAINCRIGQIKEYLAGEHDSFLARDVLDKQIIDIEGMRVVRVNDVELVHVNGSVVARNVDIGPSGILRRNGWLKPVQKFIQLFRGKLPRKFISWDDVELLSEEHRIRLRVPGDKLSKLHPADIANILSDMNRLQTSQFIDTLNLEQLVDTLEEVEEDFQVHIVETMPDEKVADVLEEMSPDEAADLLAELPKDRSDRLINLMEVDEAKDVRKLLTFPEESAGGIMTTEYIAIYPTLNAEQTIQRLREIGEEAELIYYVYVTDTEGHLEGVFSLSDLIMAKPRTSVTEFMHKRIVSANLLDSQEEVAQQIAKYNLLGIPVVDDQNILHGVVTADDALDKIIPTAWKKRLPHYYR